MVDAWVGYMGGAGTKNAAGATGKRFRMNVRPGAQAKGGRIEAMAAKRLDVAECEEFLLLEARLLDEARFDEWLALFSPEASYWVPSEPGQVNPLETVSLIYDDRQLLETRVRRLASPRIYSLEPRSRQRDA
jgi:hypothetical protein